MYYKVYGNINGWKEIDRATEEIDIIDTIGYYIGNNSGYEYIIIRCEENQDFPYRTINSRLDYIKYLQEVTDREKLKKKSYIK